MLTNRVSTLSILSLLLIATLTLTTISSKALASEQSCDGKRMELIEANNENVACAILIDDELVFPRNLIAHENQIWLIDKGSNLFINGKNNGALYRYEKILGAYLRTQVLSHLDDPNDIGIRQHSDGQHWVYFTTRNTVQRIKANATQAAPEIVISNLFTYGWHKLAAIHLTQDKLYLTVPSASDHCETKGASRQVEFPCSEEQKGTAVIREYTFKEDKLTPEYKIVAQGLRDALAIEITPNKKKLIAADNGWDQIDLSGTEYEYATTPHDEINIIDLAQEKHFGWPYCFDNDLVIPPYRDLVDTCEKYQPPHILLQAHSAPLNMLYFDKELLVNLHGNNPAGGKTVAFKLDDEGLPIPTSKTKLNWHYNKSSKNALIGRPFGLSETPNNELLVTDDWNHQLIKFVFK